MAALQILFPGSRRGREVFPQQQWKTSDEAFKSFPPGRKLISGQHFDLYHGKPPPPSEELDVTQRGLSYRLTTIIEVNLVLQQAMRKWLLFSLTFSSHWQQHFYGRLVKVDEVFLLPSNESIALQQGNLLPLDVPWLGWALALSASQASPWTGNLIENAHSLLFLNQFQLWRKVICYVAVVMSLSKNHIGSKAMIIESNL